MRDRYDSDEISFDDVDDAWLDEEDSWEASTAATREPERSRLFGRKAGKDVDAGRGDIGRGVGSRGSGAAARDRGAAARGQGNAGQVQPRPAAGTTSPATDLLLLLFKVGLVVVFLLILMTFFYGITQARDTSMDPAVKEGDLVIYYRLDKDYASNDVIVVDYNGALQVRRVVAVAGDTVDISSDGGLIVNGSTQIEDSIYTTTLPYTDGITFPVTVGDGEVFVLGDNRTNAEDSRVYGTVAVSATKGALMTVIRRRGF